MGVPFRFETVLRVREAERDRCRMALFQQQQRHQELLATRDQLSADRLAVLDELRVLHDSGPWAADRELSRRQHADHLAFEQDRVNAEIAIAASAIQGCLNTLLEAETSVKALEKLAGRHQAGERLADQRKAERDRDDSWRAA